MGARECNGPSYSLQGGELSMEVVDDLANDLQAPAPTHNLSDAAEREGERKREREIENKKKAYVGTRAYYVIRHSQNRGCRLQNYSSGLEQAYGRNSGMQNKWQRKSDNYFTSGLEIA